MKTLRQTALVAALLVGASPAALYAQTWTSWNSAGGGVFNGTLLGNSVSYTGNFIGGQLTGGGGTNFFSPNGPYTQGGLTSPDAGGNVGFIQFYPSSVGSFSFSSAMTDVYMAFISVGQPGASVTYTFDKPFTVVSNNNTSCAYWGCGSYSVSGNSLIGNEFSGTIKFSGAISTLSMTTNPDENWHGVTIGALTAVPEPSTIGLLATGLLAIFGLARQRTRQS